MYGTLRGADRPLAVGCWTPWAAAGAAAKKRGGGHRDGNTRRSADHALITFPLRVVINQGRSAHALGQPRAAVDYRSGWPETGLVAARRTTSVFAGFRFPPEVIPLAVRWYLRSGLLRIRDVERLLAERGITLDHVTIYRRVQCGHVGRPGRCPAALRT